MQEFYLLSPKQEPTALIVPKDERSSNNKELRDGMVVIRRNEAFYNTLGQQLR